MTDFETRSHDAQLPILLELATAAMAPFGLPPETAVTLINLSENATYRLAAPDGRRFALRIHRDGYHSKTAILSELAWLTGLRRAGVLTVPVPVEDQDGAFLQEVRHPRMARPRHAVLFEWESGIEPGIGEDLVLPFEKLGEAAAKLHLHAMAWRRPPWFERFTWDFETSLGEEKPHWGRWRDGIGVDASLEKLFRRTAARIGHRLAAYGKAPERFGLIHGDLRLANLLIADGGVKIIDFDDSGFGWFMYDAATPVSFHEHDAHVPQLIESWKTGYRRVRQLDAADAAEIPTFVMLRRLLLVAWIGSRRETALARAMGRPYTEGSAALCESYLRRFG